jgi:hypothetical protein
MKSTQADSPEYNAQEAMRNLSPEKVGGSAVEVSSARTTEVRAAVRNLESMVPVSEEVRRHAESSQGSPYTRESPFYESSIDPVLAVERRTAQINAARELEAKQTMGDGAREYIQTLAAETPAFEQAPVNVAAQQFDAMAQVVDGRYNSRD